MTVRVAKNEIGMEKDVGSQNDISSDKSNNTLDQNITDCYNINQVD